MNQCAVIIGVMTFVGSIANFATNTSIPKKKYMAENDALQVNKQNMNGTHILTNDYFSRFSPIYGFTY